MKQALQFRLGQNLTMTPQLQQAIRLLQLSTLELSTEIQDALDSNMMLEVGDESENNESDKSAENSAENKDATQPQETAPESSGETNIEAASDVAASETMPDDLPVDTSWDDIYDSILPGTSSATSATYNADDQPEVYTASTESLHDNLRWQIKMTPSVNSMRLLQK